MNTKSFPVVLAIIFIGCSLGCLLGSCTAIQKAESKLGITTPAQQAALNVTLEGDALKGLAELTSKKPAIAAEDAVNSAVDDLAAQIAASPTATTAGKLTVVVSKQTRQLLVDYKTDKGALVSDGVNTALQVLTAATPTATAAAQ